MPEPLAVSVLYYLLVYATLFAAIYWLLLLFKKKESLIDDPPATRFPSITLLIPAYNEADNLEEAVESVLKQDYKGRVKVVIIDDASTDKTPKIGNKLAGKDVKYVMHEKNKGKAAALNTGLKGVKTELVGFMDADSLLEKNVFKNMVGYFKGDVEGVIASIIPKNDQGVLGRLQKVEYIVASLMRKLMSFIDALYMTPGFALYKTRVLKSAGGFDEDNPTEDLEIGLKLKDRGHNIESSFGGKIRTVVPDTLRGLYRQRVRWYRGLLYNSRKYKHIFFNSTHRSLGFFVLPIQIITVSLIFPLIAYGFFKGLGNVWQTFLDLSSVNYDVLYLLLTSKVNFDPTVAFFYICVVIPAAVSIWYGEKHLRKVNPLEYVAYLIVFPLMNIIFWVAAIVQEVLGMRRKW